MSSPQNFFFLLPPSDLFLSDPPTDLFSSLNHPFCDYSRIHTPLSLPPRAHYLTSDFVLPAALSEPDLCNLFPLIISDPHSCFTPRFLLGPRLFQLNPKFSSTSDLPSSPRSHSIPRTPGCYSILSSVCFPQQISYSLGGLETTPSSIPAQT